MDGWKQNIGTRREGQRMRRAEGRTRVDVRGEEETTEGGGMEKKELTGNIFECLFNHNYH